MVFDTLIGCAVFSATNLSLLYTSHLLVRRFFSHLPHAARLVGIGVLYYALIIVLLQALSPWYAITRTWVAAGSLMLALLSHGAWGTYRDFRADFAPLRDWFRDGLNSRWACLIVICGFVVLLSFTRALLMPPLAWDCLTYHLTLAALWVKKGAIFLFTAPDQIAENAYFPINGELIACWLLLPFRNDLLINTMNFPITFLGGIACYAIARELGLSRREASFAPALICFAPMIYAQITTAYVDNATFAFFCASVLFTLRYMRNGYRCEGFMALIAAGVMFGMKYSALPAVGLIFLVTAWRTVRLPGYSGVLRKSAVVIISVFILLLLGGRQYVHNAIEAHNPLYPFPLAIGGQEILRGAESIKEVSAWVVEFEQWRGLNKFSFFEREYRKFLYVILTAGPKLFLFLLLAVFSLLIKPKAVSRGEWYILALLWIIPLSLYYINTSAAFVRKAIWIESSTRFLSPFAALIIIQGLAALQMLSAYFRRSDFLLAILVAWDLFHTNKEHLWRVELLYPLMIVATVVIIIAWGLLKGGGDRYRPFPTTLSLPSVLQRLKHAVVKSWSACLLGFLMATLGLSLLHSYRDSTRYTYYRQHYDLHDFPRSLVNAWEFLDRRHEHKTIALTVAWEPPGHTWFFYPLLGRWLQNDIVYISAKDREEVPVRLHHGLLRGDNYLIWLYNVARSKVDFIVAVNNLVYPFVMNRGELFQETWPVEAVWMEENQELFQLVFSDRCCKIFKRNR